MNIVVYCRATNYIAIDRTSKEAQGTETKSEPIPMTVSLKASFLRRFGTAPYYIVVA